MAVTNKNERIVHAYRVASIPDNATPAAWAPPTLTPSESSSELSMQFTARPKQQQSESRHYSTEEGMVFISAGNFIMGDDEGPPDERPERTVLLNTYWIDRYPVTNEKYKAFVDATGHRRPPNWTNGTYSFDLTKHPVTNVSAEDALAYATWAGKRLPTEAEWEKAARGTMGQTYPWGDAFRKDHVNSNNDYEGSTPVDRFEGGTSPYGVSDMCGNVQEWCQDWYFDDYYETAPVDNPAGPSGGQYRVCRGGFYAEIRVGVRCAGRHFAPEEVMQDHLGFRCAKTPVLQGEKSHAAPAEPKIAKEAPKPNRVALSDESSMEQIASDWPEIVANVLRSILQDWEGDNSEPAQSVAALVIGLGQVTGARILKFMTELEIEKIAQSVINSNGVAADKKNKVFEEIKRRVISGDYQMSGGIDVAKGTLEKALGPRKALVILDRINSTTSSGFEMLRNVDPNLLIPFLAKEHPQTISLILSQLDTLQAARVIDGLPKDMQVDVAFRIGQMENISPQVLRELEESLAKELQAIVAGQVKEIGGPKAVAEILNSTGRSTEKDILEGLDAKDSQFAEVVRNQMFIFDDIANLTDREVQIIHKEVDSKDLAVALKGASEKLQDRIFGNLGEEATKKIKEEMQFSGPVRISDVVEVQLRIVQNVRQLEEAGKVTIVRGETRDNFV